MIRVGIEKVEMRLWEEILKYHHDRIEESYIFELRASFKGYEAQRTRTMTVVQADTDIEAALSTLRALLFDRNIFGSSKLERHQNLAIATYTLRRSRAIEEALYSSPSANSKSKKLWVNVCLLARLRIAHQTFKEIAVTLPSFQNPTIILVPRPSAPALTVQSALTLSQTFALLHLPLHATTIKAVLGHSWTVARLDREFRKRQKQKLNTHAEVQMLMFLHANEASASGVLPYLGCSKLSCFMCNRFLQAYGKFATRGCHGRLFRPWTVPNVDALLAGHADRTAKALIAVQKGVEKELKASVEVYLQHERTSVVGGSSVFSGRRGEQSQRDSQIVRLRMQAERERIAEIFRR
jgi:hypothetical protein